MSAHTYIALLRGINVGGNKMVKMADLRTCLSAAGFSDVKTLLQSGNVILRSTLSDPAEVKSLLEKTTETQFGFTVDYFVRDLEQWEAAIAANPFPEAAKDDPSHLLVVFTASPPDANAVKAVQDANPGPEKLAVASGNLYIVYPIGIGDSKLHRVPGWSKIGGTGTARNWNTVLKLDALAKAL